MSVELTGEIKSAKLKASDQENKVKLAVKFVFDSCDSLEIESLVDQWQDEDGEVTVTVEESQQDMFTHDEDGRETKANQARTVPAEQVEAQ